MPEVAETTLASEKPTIAKHNRCGKGLGRPFQKGHKLSKGNPVVRQQAELRRLLIDDFKNGELDQVRKTLMEKAIGGDVQAIKLIYAYLMGQPTETMNLNAQHTFTAAVAMDASERVAELNRIMDERRKNVAITGDN